MPDELILKNDYMIAGGAHYSLAFNVKLGKKDERGEFSENEMAKRIGLLVNIPDESIFDSCTVPLYHLGLASTYFIRNKQPHFTL